MSMSLHLALLLASASSAPAAPDTFEVRRLPEPPTPDPTRGQGGVDWAPPRPMRQGRECPTCGTILGLDARTCEHGHREVKTRRVALDGYGRPVRRRR